jgi:hypothetical protein
MKPRIVVDTNLWIRALVGGPATLPVLEAWRAGKFLQFTESLAPIWGRIFLICAICEASIDSCAYGCCFDNA